MLLCEGGVDCSEDGRLGFAVGAGLVGLVAGSVFGFLGAGIGAAVFVNYRCGLYD